jgi:hypothetical protein
VWLLAVGLTTACGKKGPPLAPFVPIPGAVESIEAQRLGSDVFVTLTIPAANIDEHTPADLDRIEVYAYTGRSAPPRAQWVELATLVATVPVASPPAQETRREREDGNGKPANAPLQGTRVTVRDTLTADELVPGKQPVVRRPAAEPRETEPTPPRTRVAEEPLNRYYTAVPFNPRGRPGPPGGVAEFPLVPAPDPPPSLVARYTGREVALAWEPSGGLIGFLLERAVPEEPIPFVEGEGEEIEQVQPPGPLSYHVYRESLPDTMTPPPSQAEAWGDEPPVPVTAAPVSMLEFTHPIEFDRRRCYTVRAVRGAGPGAQVGDSSPAACLTPIDVFPPGAPRSLAAVASEGAISLIWEPNADVDLGGYIVLRGEAPGDTLRPLTDAPVTEAAYRDQTVTPGVRYVYAVLAVDNRLPLPNVSAASDRVEETAR